MAEIIQTKPAEITLLVDEQGSITYIGRAKKGTALNDPFWQIRRIQFSGTTNTFQYANGSARYNQVWNNRGGLIYSN